MHGGVFVLEARGWNVDFFFLLRCMAHGGGVDGPRPGIGG